MTGTAGESTLCLSLQFLTKMMEIKYGKKVIVLIDEYDDPVNNAYGTDDFRRILNFLRDMLGSLFKGNPSLDFAVI